MQFKRKENYSKISNNGIGEMYRKIVKSSTGSINDFKLRGFFTLSFAGFVKEKQ